MSMADDAVEKLKKLPPEERIKRLKKLENERKEQEDEAKKLLEESLDEIERDRALENVELPDQELVDVSKLFKSEESLEETVEEEAPINPPESEGQYFIPPEELSSPTPNLGEIAQPIYNRLMQMRERVESNQPLDVYDQNLARVVRERLPKFKVDYTYTKADEVVRMLDASARILEELGYTLELDHKRPQ